MKYTCPNCGVVSEVKHAARVAAGKRLAASLTKRQRADFGSRGGWPKGRPRKPSRAQSSG